MNKEKEFNIYKYIGVQTDSATITELVDKYHQLEQQLQAYKAKEDKLRELVKTYSCRFNKGFPYDKVCIFQGDISIKNEYLDLQIIINEFLQILNEGGK